MAPLFWLRPKETKTSCQSNFTEALKVLTFAYLFYRFDSGITNACMALVPGSPDIHGRSMSSREGGENITEALRVLDTVITDKKDLSKGNYLYCHSTRHCEC